ncbi:glycogen debranching N-terminal domain-containing protein [Benzoatithermus flavus]|uniref:Amylo-alpha-1,6-glucosidase n=1 Tax=Benzoatithermus flavus TaxID=3108223 RepID=A0ABU8XMH6_9PROT
MDLKDGTGGPATPPHYIASAKSLPERRLRTLKHADAFAILDPFGDIPGDEGAPEGLYVKDTRVLSCWRLEVAGARPLLLGSAVRNDNAFLSCDLTNPDLVANGEVVVPRDNLHLRRIGLLEEGGYAERLVIENHGMGPVELELDYRFAADFADMFEVRGESRPKRGRLLPPRVEGEEVVLAYDGLDEIRRTVRLRFDPKPHELTPDRARFFIRLGAGESAAFHASIGVAIGGDVAGRSPPAFLPALRGSQLTAIRHLALLPQLSASSQDFSVLLRRSRADLAMLVTPTPQGPYPYAGIPWFSTVFGRDGLLTALSCLWLAPGIAEGVLRFLAVHQATDYDAFADAEPGKILHEMRNGEMANLGEVPFGRYYGSIDSTPLFVLLAGAHLERTGDVAFARELWPAIEAALGWIGKDGDRDGDGFVEYGRRAESGLVNQGWKDSQDGVSHADGSLPEGPIALVEVQAYVYGAYRAAAAIARALGETARAGELEAAAKRLRERFEAAFWLEDRGTYALALDGRKRPCAVRSSNAGHALLTGIAAPERAARVAATLMDKDGFSGWGVRTLAAGEARYNPISYHNGSIWPHDNAIIAMGLARYGHKDAVLRILSGIAEAAGHLERHRLPELFCGFGRRSRSGPVRYPVACEPQAWAAAAPYGLLQACLGISFAVDAREIRFDRPELPPWLDQLVVRDLPFCGSKLDLAVQRVGESVIVRVLRRDGDARVVVTK